MKDTQAFSLIKEGDRENGWEVAFSSTWYRETTKSTSQTQRKKKGPKPGAISTLMGATSHRREQKGKREIRCPVANLR